ncbi:MAG: hypothetical protein ABI824_04535 [Acidobacteriota bacterium]
MAVNIEELQKRFASLTDEALLEVKRDDLVAGAQACLDQEFADRGLDIAPGHVPSDREHELNAEGLAPVEAEGEGNQVGWEFLQEFDTPEEVSIAISLLRSAEIPAYTPSQDVSRVNPLAGLIEGAFRVYVPTGMAEEAREILDTPVSDEELAAQAEAAGGAAPE